MIADLLFQNLLFQWSSTTATAYLPSVSAFFRKSTPSLCICANRYEAPVHAMLTIAEKLFLLLVPLTKILNIPLDRHAPSGRERNNQRLLGLLLHRSLRPLRLHLVRRLLWRSQRATVSLCLRLLFFLPQCFLFRLLRPLCCHILLSQSIIERSLCLASNHKEIYLGR